MTKTPVTEHCKSSQSLLADMNVSGDLAGLLLNYVRQNAVKSPELEQSLQQFKPSSRMTFRQWWGFLDQLQQMYPNRLVGMELGSFIAPAHVGVLGYLTLSCATVAEALQRFQRYQALLHDGDHAQLILGQGLAILRWDSKFGPSTQLSDEVLVMGMLNIVRRMTGNDTLQPARVSFVCAGGSSAEHYQPFLTCPLGFQQPFLELAFPQEILALPVTNSDPSLRELLEQQAQALMQVLPPQDPLLGRVQSAIIKSIEDGDATLKRVSEILNMSQRTLHRRLQDRQLVFKSLLQTIRMELARKYLLEQHLTLTEIALLLGYSEQSAFSRAFRQWYGTAPLQYQKHHKMKA